MTRLLAIFALLTGLFMLQPAYAQNICPDNFLSFAGTSAPVTCTCSAEAAELGNVWGMDIYTGDSSVCRSALHAGAIPASGGVVMAFPMPGQTMYVGVTRNGVSSSNWERFDSSFAFAGGVPVAVPAPVPVQVPVVAAPVAVQGGGVCPDNFVSYRGSQAPLACACSAEAAERGNVWGTDIYTDDSSVCRAALHAGIIGVTGGFVSVLPLPGQKTYPGVTRNGVGSQNWDRHPGSFSFGGGQVAMTTPIPVPVAAAPASASVCPDNFLAYAGTASTLTCGCSAEAALIGNVWGTDVYTGDSGVCRAALHAGVITPQGGNIAVTPLPGRSSYPGVTRNGVGSQNWAAFDSSFSVATALAVSAVPVQAPVAQSLQATGQVQLYINFAFNSADLLASSTPVLNELYAALQGNPALRLTLVGHTDAIGSADYNMVLSAQRAQSVAMWLVARGIAPSRLATSGRGFYEPIADNATDYGRALNRRVQAISM